MSDFNPMHYVDEAMIIGVAMIALGAMLLGLVAVLSTKRKAKCDCD